jgi:ribosomal protein S18 acetylase RimI-like enzyme
MSKHRITRRPITEDDMDFLQRLYASTREEELALTDWDQAQKEAFVRMQFAAQHSYYTEQFPLAAYELMVLDGEPIGRLYVDRRPDEIRVLDIALLPQYRNKGIGTRSMREIMDEAAAAGLAVRIHVEQYSPALRFYQRLDFRTVSEHGIHYLMEWLPVQAGRS